MRPLLIIVSLFTCATAALRAQPYEQRVVAAVIAAEAANQGRRGMLAVGEVIHARCVHLGLRPLEVVTQRNRSTGYWAFSCLNGMRPESLVKKWQSDSAYAQALDIAKLVVKQPKALGTSTRGATFFTLRTETPVWAI